MLSGLQREPSSAGAYQRRFPEISRSGADTAAIATFLSKDPFQKRLSRPDDDIGSKERLHLSHSTNQFTYRNLFPTAICLTIGIDDLCSSTRGQQRSAPQIHSEPSLYH